MSRKRRASPTQDGAATTAETEVPQEVPVASQETEKPAAPAPVAVKEPPLYVQQDRVKKLMDEFVTTVKTTLIATTATKRQTTAMFARIIKTVKGLDVLPAYADLLQFFQDHLNLLTVEVTMYGLSQMDRAEIQLVVRYHTVFTELVETLRSRGTRKFRFDLKAVAKETSETCSSFIASKLARV